MSILKIISIINWIVVVVLAILVTAETISPAKGGDAAGRGIGQAFYYLAIIALILLLLLNLLPYNWSKYAAFALILMPLFLIKLNGAMSSVKKWANRVPQGKNADGSAWFADPEKQRIALAIDNGDVEKVKKLLSEPHPGIDERDRNGDTLLGFAISAAQSGYKPEERLECLRLLFQAGARLEVIDTDGVPLHMTPASNGYVGLLKILLDHGADANARHPYFDRPVLFEAISAWQNGAETVQALLDHGADPNALGKDDDGQSISVLLYAAKFGRWNLCPLLLERGADLHYKKADGTSLKTLVEAADESFTGDGYATRADFERVKKAVSQ